MNTIENITAGFNNMVPGLAQDYVDFVTRQWDNVIERYPRFAGLSNSFSRDGGIYRSTLRQFVKNESYQPRGPISLDVERLHKVSTQYAEDQVAKFVHKLNQKLVDLEDVNVIDMSWDTFTITGSLKGKRVAVQQRRVLNCSPKGTLFHQWPAKIYVDGKFTSEKKFKEMAKS